MTTREFISAIATFLYVSKDLVERDERIREANRALFAECVGGTEVEADLALAEAAVQSEMARAQENGRRRRRRRKDRERIDEGNRERAQTGTEPARTLP